MASATFILLTRESNQRSTKPRILHTQPVHSSSSALGRKLRAKPLAVVHACADVRPVVIIRVLGRRCAVLDDSSLEVAVLTVKYGCGLSVQQSPRGPIQPACSVVRKKPNADSSEASEQQRILAQDRRRSEIKKLRVLLECIPGRAEERKRA